MAKKPKYKASDQEGPVYKYSQDEGLLKEIKDRYKYASGHYSRWETEAKEDYKFALGDQWTEDDRQALKNQGRPCLTFNRIKPILSIISGYQRENTPRVKVNPEGGEDRIFSEVMDRIIRAMDKWSHLSYKEMHFFDDGCRCGKGWLEGYLSYEKDPVRGELAFRLLSPYQVLPDPDFREYDLNDGCPYVFKIVPLTKSELKDLYPSKADLIDGFVKDTDDPVENGFGAISQEGADDDYGNRPNITTIVNRTDAEEPPEQDTRFTLKEYWRLRKVTKYFVIDKTEGIPKKFGTKEEAQAFIDNQAFGKIIERKVNEMQVSAVACGWILQEDVSPFEPYTSRYPFHRFIAEFAPNAETEDLRVQGIVRALKDPQKEKNKAKSQNLHILNTQANSGWIGDEDALTDPGWANLESLGSKPGITVKKKKGSELREIQPKGPNVGMLQRENKAEEEFIKVSLINPDLMGIQEGTASGRAISLRIKQAILGLSSLFANFRYSQEILGNFMLELIPLLFDGKKIIRTIGPDYMAKALDKEKYPGGLKEGNIEAFLTMVKDHKYDTSITDAGHNETMRFEIFQELSELLKGGAPIPIELLIDYMDLPNSQEVKDKIKEYQQRLAAAAATAKGAPGA